jgi:hypothetical protein
MDVDDLYKEYPLGGQPGWYAFVFNEHNFAYWHFGENKWKLLPAYFTVSDFLMRIGLDPDKIKTGDGLFWDEEKETFSYFGIRIVSSKPDKSSGNGLYLMYDNGGNTGIYVIFNEKILPIFESFTREPISETDTIRLLMEEKMFTQIAPFDPYSPGYISLSAFVIGNTNESLHQPSGGGLRKIRVDLLEECTVRPIIVDISDSTIIALGGNIDLPVGFSEISGSPFVFQRNFSNSNADNYRIGLQSMAGVPMKICESRSVNNGMYYEISDIGVVGSIATVSSPVSKRLCLSFFMSSTS